MNTKIVIVAVSITSSERSERKIDFELSKPKQPMIIVTLENGNRFAVRASGTEPKIKYYLFGNSEANPSDLAATKLSVDGSLQELWKAIESDAQNRMN